MINNFPIQLNVELTSRCNKNCWMCGRRQREKLYGNQNYGDIDFELLKIIASQLPIGTIVALHNNGEFLLYDMLYEAIELFKDNGCYVYGVSNGKLLMEKRSEVLNNLDQVCISVIEDDTDEERELQYETLLKFSASKSYLDKPLVVLRFVGDIKDEQRYIDLGLPIVRRTLHKPEGSIGYRSEPMRPEFLVCWDLMTRLSINRFGDISLCVRFDHSGELILGNVRNMTIHEAWRCDKRMDVVDNMINGKRIGYCGEKCSYWGVPTK